MGTNDQQIEPGDFVLVRDNGPRTSWRLAVVESLLKGNNGLIRSANIRTSNGKTSPPVARSILQARITKHPTSTTCCQRNWRIHADLKERHPQRDERKLPVGRQNYPPPRGCQELNFNYTFTFRLHDVLVG